jgi:exo-beta-1,3-glucanase (GH17 family)
MFNISKLSASLLFLVAVSTYVDVNALNVKLYGINYDLRQGPDWDPKKCKTEATVKNDLKTLSAITDNIRTYALSDCPIRPVIKAAKAQGLTIWLGMWVDKEPSAFEKELVELKKLIDEKLIDDNIAGINVGSEALYRKDVTPQEAIANYKAVKAAVTKAELKKPLSITDICDSLTTYPEVVKEVDVVTANQFPFWEKTPVDKAAQRFYDRIQPLLQITGEKPIIITETGWSSMGSNVNASIASQANQAKYLNDFVLLAEKEKWKYYYFAAFDATYKKEVEDDEDTVEQGFGLFDNKGKLKPEIQALTISAASIIGSADKIISPDQNRTDATNGVAGIYSSTLTAIVMTMTTVCCISYSVIKSFLII